jgi:hypothetical protein
VEKHGRAKQDKDDSIIWRMRMACWITNTFAFSTPTMGTRTHLSVTYIRTLPALFDTTGVLSLISQQFCLTLSSSSGLKTSVREFLAINEVRISKMKTFQD